MISQKVFEKLMNYVDYIDNYYEELTIKKPLSQEEKVLACMCCLTEEVGEAASEIRKKLKLSFSRKKVNEYSDEHLEEELGDILITFLSLCKSLKISNLDALIQKKIEKNNNRGYSEIKGRNDSYSWKDD